VEDGVLDQPSPKHQPDANGRLFGRLVWSPALVRRRPPNGGLALNLQQRIARSRNGNRRYYDDLHWEITLQ
jgi:hypothetical protein